jgi:uncharacterized OB-fold protein
MTQAIPKPLPVTDEDTKPFWDYCKQHELRVQKCGRCGKLHYPPSAICPHCLHMESEWVKLSGKGQVYSFIIVRRQYHPGFAKDLPYTVAIIETAEGARMLSNVIGCKPEAVKIGMPVEVTFEDVSGEFALPKFKPAIKID